jgi:MFS family permease
MALAAAPAHTLESVASPAAAAAPARAPSPPSALARALALARPPRMLRSAPPNGGFAWLTVAAAFAVYVVAVGFMYVSGLFYSAWLLDADATFSGLADARASLGLVNGVNVLFFLGASLAAGVINTRFGERGTLACGAALVLAGVFGAALLTVPGGDGARNVAVATLCYGVLMGSGASFAQLAVMVGLFKYFTTRRGIAIGICVSGSGVGGVVLGPLLQSAIAASGWRVALVEYGVGAATVIGLAALAFVPLEDDVVVGGGSSGGGGGGGGGGGVVGGGAAAEVAAADPAAALTPPQSPARAGAESGAVSAPLASPPASPPASALTTVRSHDNLVGAGGGDALVAGAAATLDWAELKPTLPAAPAEKQAAPPASARLSLREIVRVVDFRLYCVFVTGMACSWFIVPSHFPRFAIESGLGAESAGKLIAVQGVANAVGRVGLGLLVDAMPKRKVEMLRFITVGMAIAYFSLAFLPPSWFTFVFMVLSGLLGGSLVSLQPSLVIDILGEANLSLGQGAFNSAQAPFGLFGPPLGGLIRSVSGSYTFVWVFTSFMAGYASLATQLMMRPALQRRVLAALCPCARGGCAARS